jgi:hypothetical protein
VLTVAYSALGFAYSSHAGLELQLYKGVLIGLAVAAALFVAVYTVIGLKGAARWWKNDIGLTLVLKDVAIAFAVLPPILSIFFQFGRLTSDIAAWIDIGALGAASLIIFWRTWIWVRIARQPLLPVSEAAIAAGARVLAGLTMDITPETTPEALARRILEAAREA